ncbi:MAG TPA: ISKra4 family transposase [Ktedonobacteraceae bacterium]|nr:ISKra4 family transposase [Ktedonobacteraceae bacterium]
MELQPGSVTPLQLKHLVHFSSFHSFEEAAQMLQEHHGVQVSASTVRRQTEDIGAEALVVQDEKEQKPLCSHTRVKEGKRDKKADKVMMSSDGSYISLVGKRVAEVKTMVIGEVKENTKPSKQRMNQEVKTTALSYFSRMTDSATFITLATKETQRRGLLQAKQVCAVQDGAEWIQECIDAHRPEAVRILDFYHAAQYISDIATLVSSAGTTLEDRWRDQQLHELKHQGPKKVLEELHRLLHDHPQVEDLKKKVMYLQKREKLMNYPLFQQQGWPIGSGSVESANKCVVQRRLDGPGMHWHPRHVNPLLALRTGICNERWDETYQQAFGHRLLTRKKNRFARQKKRYDALYQKVQQTLLRFFLLAPPLKPQQKKIPLPSHPSELAAVSTHSLQSSQARIPASNHPWRRFARAKK